MTIQRKYNFQPGTKISSSQVNEEFDQLINSSNTNEQNMTIAQKTATDVTSLFNDHIIQPTAHSVATATNNGFMSSTDKSKLDVYPTVAVAPGTVLYNNATGIYLHDTQTVTPSQPLDKMFNGWMLIWSDYNAGDPTPTGDYDYAVTFIHKAQPKKSTLQAIPNFLSDTDQSVAVKGLTFTNTTITGNSGNGTNPMSKDVVLRQIIAW